VVKNKGKVGDAIISPWNELDGNILSYNNVNKTKLYYDFDKVNFIKPKWYYQTLELKNSGMKLPYKITLNK
jgi:hypothetical protein